jgi:hypothetical protein
LVYVAGLPCSEEAGLPRDSTTKPEFGLRVFWHVINEGISFSAYKRIRLSAYPELTLQRDRATKGAELLSSRSLLLSKGLARIAHRIAYEQNTAILATLPGCQRSREGSLKLYL